MKIILAGGTGFIGRALAPRLAGEGHEIVLLVRGDSRRAPEAGERRWSEHAWDPATPGPWMERLDGADAVINFAGAPIAEKRWTRARKEVILNSRLQSTRALTDAAAQARKKPSVWINASAVGYYGDVPEGDAPESRPRGRGFLAEVCEAWENEAQRAQAHGARVVRLRIGVVLEKDGGALQKMMPPFQFFLGGPLGSGRQWFPWIHREDLVGIVLFALGAPGLAGAVNAAAPEPARMREFCSGLGKAMGRPSWAPAPGFALRLALGEMSEMLLTGQRAVPQRLLDAGFRFRFPRLDSALADIFSR